MKLLKPQLKEFGAREQRRPVCRVWLVCGPVAAGKSTYVAAHAGPDDLTIDFDDIAREQGIGRNRSAYEDTEVGFLRNARIAALAEEPSTRTAWVTMCAPSAALRQWWCNKLGVPPERLIVLRPSRDELIRRIMNDPSRRHVQALHIGLVDKWFAHERASTNKYKKRAVNEYA